MLVRWGAPFGGGSPIGNVLVKEKGLNWHRLAIVRGYLTICKTLPLRPLFVRQIRPIGELLRLRRAPFKAFLLAHAAFLFGEKAAFSLLRKHLFMGLMAFFFWDTLHHIGCF